MSAWTCECGQTVRGLKPEHCVECHQTFTTTTAGDAHRVGPHDGERRCLTPDEMTSRSKRPLERDKRGYWRFVSDGQPEHWGRTARQELSPEDSRPEQTITEQERGSSPSGPQKGAERCGVDALNCVLTTVVERTDIDWATVYEDDDT